MKKLSTKESLRSVENLAEANRDDLRSLQTHLAAALTDIRLLKHEWEETHRKLLNTLRSINRAGGRGPADADDAEAATEDAPGLDPISASILKRRGGLRAVPNNAAKASG